MEVRLSQPLVAQLVSCHVDKRRGQQVNITESFLSVFSKTQVTFASKRLTAVLIIQT